MDTNPQLPLKRHKGGFTLIELLVVIAIIGVLAAVVLAALNASRDKADYAKVARELREMEKALNLLYHDDGCWPKENSSQSGSCAHMVSGATANPTIAQVLASNTNNLKNYLPAAPVFPFTSTTGYFYDRDGDTYVQSACTSGTASARNTNSAQGVNIIMGGVDASVFSALDRIFDGSNGVLNDANRYCGKIRYTTGTPPSLIYSISYTP